MGSMGNGRWSAELPFELWDAAIGASDRSRFATEDIVELRAWARACGGWFRWDDKAGLTVYTPLEEWISIWKNSSYRARVPDIRSIAAAVDDQARSYRLFLLAILESLRLVDAALVDLAVQVLGSEIDAAEWFTTPLLPLTNKSPLDVMAAGQNQSIAEVLHRIEHGIPS